MVAQNVFHRASSHQTTGLWRFADRCNILQSRLSQCFLESQLFLCTSGIVAPTLNSLDDISPSLKQSELYCCFSVPLSWPPFLLWTFFTSHAGLKLLPFLVHCCLCSWNLHYLGHRNSFSLTCNAILNFALSLQCFLHEPLSSLTPFFVLWIHVLQKQQLNPALAHDSLVFSFLTQPFFRDEFFMNPFRRWFYYCLVDSFDSVIQLNLVLASDTLAFSVPYACWRKRSLTWNCSCLRCFQLSPCHLNDVFVFFVTRFKWN